MTIIDFYSTPIDDIDDSDFINALYIAELLGNDCYGIRNLPKVSMKEVLLRSLSMFNKYRNAPLMNKLDVKKQEICYLANGSLRAYSFTFDMMFFGGDGKMVPTIVWPDVVDKASYAFLGHGFHHALKVDNYDELKLKNRVNDVIPMFYELMCADYDYNEDISKEIYRRRLILLRENKKQTYDSQILQEFNSYYYALGLFNKYKKDSLLVLRLLSRVLNGEITTIDLLKMLDLYENDLDYVVSKELETIKQYILS